MKSKAWHEQHHTARVKRKAAKAAKRANRGRYATMTGEDKHGAEKRALKRHFDVLAISTPLLAVLPQFDAQMPVRTRFLPTWAEWRKAS